MATKIENWREKELSIEEVFDKYKEIPKIVILKTDVHRRGYILSEKAQKLFNEGDYQSQADTIFGKKEGENKIPIGLIFRDGTSLVGGYLTNYGIRDPYVIDEIDGKFYLTDSGKVYEEVDFWREPDFYRKKTSKGTPMGEVVNVRPQRLNVAISRVCHFWDKPGEGCKYCNVGINGIDSVNAEFICSVSGNHGNIWTLSVYESVKRISEIMLSVCNGEEHTVFFTELSVSVKNLFGRQFSCFFKVAYSKYFKEFCSEVFSLFK